MEKVYTLFEHHGADIWFEKTLEELLPEGTVCSHCGHGRFVKETDILDVWFDSGVSHAAVLEQRDDLKWPADLYLEGSDQHRGWFHSSLLSSVGTRGRAPYEAVLTHGFVVDANGHKMSKSLGNIIAPKEVINRYGAEILRLWVSATDYREDIRISENILQQLSDAYRRIRNTARFMLGNLFDYDPQKDAVAYDAMQEIDRYALHGLQELIRRCRKAYDAYEFHTIYHTLHNYCALDLSAFYLDVLKDRLYTSPPGSAERRSAQTALHAILDAMVRIMAPILSFTAEEIWGFLPQVPGKTDSVHETELPAPDTSLVNAALAENWGRILAVRVEVTRALEAARAQKIIGHPLDAAVTLSAADDLYRQLLPYAEALRSIFIVSTVDLAAGGPLAGALEGAALKGLSVRVDVAKGDKCQRCWVHDPDVGKNETHPGICPRCETALGQIG
jgi:isoleucyl-tRNA synthetase